MTARGRDKQSRLELVTADAPVRTMPVLRTIDLLSGARGITEGFRQAGYECLICQRLDAGRTGASPGIPRPIANWQ